MSVSETEEIFNKYTYHRDKNLPLTNIQTNDVSFDDSTSMRSGLPMGKQVQERKDGYSRQRATDREERSKTFCIFFPTTFRRKKQKSIQRIP